MAKDFVILTSAETYPTFAQQTKAALLAARVRRHVSSQLTVPTQPNPATDVSQKEARIFEENEDQALGIILERLDASNVRLVGDKGPYDAWELLKTTHITKTANCQYQLTHTLAAGGLSASLATGAMADNIITMLTTFIATANLEPSEENEAFELNLSVAGKVDSATIAESFRTEQMCRDVAACTKEAGLAIRLGQSSRRGPKAGSPTCTHCQKAHKSEDCYTKHPEKMPQWMKD
ncbi:hypothetical protein M407DRAFT_33652 [Tulasnella calospora MUT 4182]|uniref:Uncharacterized protein n=1 Tax=Tulasnella calospora MUT 4182 TaxID=1051891 RepID=A0A0C3L4Z7_9AGAM|nr:hypothetical protein M407DRAFT_33652 [Tulasnella calospora MUT 4182]